mmetsp:Transcript_51554/g.116015  ORF Transcript_51554/g.116015 Transcript_51554/m.116015 type:complete len:229 (-) Transcript_51554:92-778(-)
MALTLEKAETGDEPSSTATTAYVSAGPASKSSSQGDSQMRSHRSSSGRRSKGERHALVAQMLAEAQMLNPSTPRTEGDGKNNNISNSSSASTRIRSTSTDETGQSRDDAESNDGGHTRRRRLRNRAKIAKQILQDMQLDKDLPVVPVGHTSGAGSKGNGGGQDEEPQLKGAGASSSDETGLVPPEVPEGTPKGPGKPHETKEPKKANPGSRNGFFACCGRSTTAREDA